MSKENSIVKGGFISSISLFLTKFLGIIYIIPLNMILATSLNRDYFSVGFRVYEIILSVSISGFPIAVATLIAKYEAQGNYENVRLVKKYGDYVLGFFGFLMMVILIAFANPIAALIKNPAPVHEIETIAVMLRILAVAIFIVSMLGTLRGFYQGIKKIGMYSFSQFIEQVIRVVFIVVMGYLVVDIFRMDRVFAVYITAIAAGLSALVAYILLFIDYRKNYHIPIDHKLVDKTLRNQIIKDTIIIAIPYMTMSLLAYATSIIELLLFNNVFDAIGYSLELRKEIFTAITMQGDKLSAIPLVIATGFSVASLPFLNESLTKKDYKRLRQQIVDVLSTVLIIGIPLCMGIIFYTREIFHIFFGNTAPHIGVPVVKVAAILAISTIILNICVAMAMAINVRKYVLITYLFAILTKLAWYYPSAVFFGMYGPSISSLIANIVQILLILVFLKIRYKINFVLVFKRLVAVMIGVVFVGLFAIIPGILNIQYRGFSGALIAMVIVMVFGGLSIISYLGVMQVFNLPKVVLGIDLMKYFKRLKKS